MASPLQLRLITPSRACYVKVIIPFRKAPQRVRQRCRVALCVALHDLADEAGIIERVGKAFAGVDVVEGWPLVIHAKQENPHRLIARDVGVA
jgi:hypothetical protein